MKNTKWMIGVLALTFVSACDNEPAEGKTKVEAKAPVAEAVEAAAKADESQVTETFAFSNDGSSVEWVGAKVTGKHEGRFEKFKGEVVLVDADPTKSKVEVVIETASIVSDTEKLTNHLKSADFFEVERFPTAKFTSTSIEEGGEGEATHTVTGNLTLHGVTKSITFPATIEVREGEVEAEAEFAIDRKDFAINYPGMPDDLIKDDVLLELDIEAKKAP